jgi:hypothetical protein
MKISSTDQEHLDNLVDHYPANALWFISELRVKDQGPYVLDGKSVCANNLSHLLHYLAKNSHLMPRLDGRVSQYRLKGTDLDREKQTFRVRFEDRIVAADSVDIEYFLQNIEEATIRVVYVEKDEERDELPDHYEIQFFDGNGSLAGSLYYIRTTGENFSPPSSSTSAAEVR